MQYWIEVNGVGPFFYIERVPVPAKNLIGLFSQDIVTFAVRLLPT